MQMSCLAIEEFDEFGDNLLRRFFHEPMAGIANDHPFAALVRICERVIFFEYMEIRTARRPFEAQDEQAAALQG